MSTTLTNGLKLPDKGSVDWYADMQNNYTILDGAVGTIAEHTSALAGKAPLVHTHTKSDITDLFNSTNTWSALNTYANGQLALKATSQEIGVIPTSDRVQFFSFNDKNSEQIGVVGIWYNSSGSTEMKLSVSDKFKDGVKDPTGTKTSELLSMGMTSNGDKFFAFEGKLRTSLYPFTTDVYNLGSSANQWNNLYAKNYFYNGVAWGLDKLNRWSKSQELRLAELEDYTLPSSEVSTELLAWWGTTNFRGGFGHQYYTNGDEGCRFLLSSKDANNNAHLTAFRYKLNRAGTDSYFYGTGAQNFHLGTSTNKWKTLNGIDPGALSLPDTSRVTDIDTTGWTFNGSTANQIKINNATQTLNGWLYIRLSSISATDSVIIRYSGSSAANLSFGQRANANGDPISITVPVVANVPTYVYVTAEPAQIRFFLSLGEVNNLPSS